MFADTLSTKLHQCTRNTFSASTFQFVKTIFQKKSFTAEVQSVRWLLSIKLTRYDNQLLTRIFPKKEPLTNVCDICNIAIFNSEPLASWRQQQSITLILGKRSWLHLQKRSKLTCFLPSNWFESDIVSVTSLKSLFVCYSRGRSYSRHFSPKSMKNTDNTQ